MDILAGWSVDPDQTEDTISRAAAILISLHDYWVEDMYKCVNMTSNFVDDIQSMSYYQFQGEKGLAEIGKMALLIR